MAFTNSDLFGVDKSKVEEKIKKLSDWLQLYKDRGIQSTGKERQEFLKETLGDALVYVKELRSWLRDLIGEKKQLEN